jgi:hypothetical protein
MVTVGLAANLGVRQVLRAVSAWLADPTGSNQVLTVS